MQKPLVSVIVLNWNGKAYLERCLDSLKNQTYSNFEIIVVDNGSTDGSVDIITEKYRDKIRLIRNNKNFGFAKGNNIGILYSQGDYIITLNNDTQVDRCWLDELVAVAENDYKIGMCASKILFLKNPNLIDSVGINIYPDGMSKQRGHLEIDTGQYNKIEEVLLPSACAALYRKQMLDEIGFFDEDFFAYCEDTDLGLRGRLAGWKAFFVPSAIVYHLYSGTGGQHSPLKAYLVVRNHFWVALKNFPLSLIITLPIYLIYRYLIQIYALFINKGKASNFVREFSKTKLFIILVKSWFDALAKLPSMWGKRKKILKNKKVSEHKIRYWLSNYRASLNDLVIKD